MDFMLYPTFEFGDGRIFPTVRLPRSYKELIPLFYEQGRKGELVEYLDHLNKHLEYCGIETRVYGTDLLWDDKKGLTTIKIKPSGGLDLEERGWPHFAEHNLGAERAFVAGAIAMKYVSELLKSQPRKP